MKNLLQSANKAMSSFARGWNDGESSSIPPTPPKYTSVRKYYLSFLDRWSPWRLRKRLVTQFTVSENRQKRLEAQSEKIGRLEDRIDCRESEIAQLNRRVDEFAAENERLRDQQCQFISCQHRQSEAFRASCFESENIELKAELEKLKERNTEMATMLTERCSIASVRPYAEKMQEEAARHLAAMDGLSKSIINILRGKPHDLNFDEAIEAMKAGRKCKVIDSSYAPFFWNTEDDRPCDSERIVSYATHDFWSMFSDAKFQIVEQ